MLPEVSAKDVVERLERELANTTRPILAFDADGTLWSGDVGIELFERLLSEEAVKAEALSALQDLAGRFDLPKADEQAEQASLLHRAFLEEKLPEDLAFAMMAWAFAGFSLGELDDFISRYLDEAGLESRMQKELAAILDWAKVASVPICIVSASPRALIVAAAARLRIEVANVAAMTPGISHGRLEPWVEEPVPYAKGKVEALRRVVNDAEILGAFGDSGYDAHLLATARVPVAVRPKPSLLARAGEVAGLVCLSA